jgi:hypothetical protein
MNKNSNSEHYQALIAKLTTEVTTSSMEIEQLQKRVLFLQTHRDQLQKFVKTLTSKYEACELDCSRAHAEVERLKTQLADIADAQKVILSEQCAPDEQHCTCVPTLRAENERLKKEIELLLSW